MIKLIRSDSFDFGMPTATLVDVWSRGIDKSWMQKRAAVLTKEISDVRPEPGYSFIHLISMGACEAFGGNRNGDFFNEKSASYRVPYPKEGSPKTITWKGGLMEYHPTFLKHAHVFKHHKNTDPSLAIGEIKAAAYNSEMRRGELLIRVKNDHPDWKFEIEKLANDESVPFSMAVKIPFDTCLYCGNQSKTRANYCDHLKNHLTEITKEGHQIGAMNDHGVFFDISKVLRPADRIAWSLNKVAFYLGAAVGGAELAEMESVVAPATVPYVGSSPAGFAQKLAAARKLAAIEKLIEGAAHGEDNAHLKSLACGCPSENIDGDSMQKLRGFDNSAVLRALSNAQICLSLPDFIRLVTGDKYSSVEEAMPSMCGMLPGMFGRMMESGDADECASDGSYDAGHMSIPRSLRDLVENMVGDHSLESGPAKRRIQITIIRGSGPAVTLSSGAGTKAAAVSNHSQDLVKEYAKYLLSFVKSAEEDEIVTRLTVLRNYVNLFARD